MNHMFPVFKPFCTLLAIVCSSEMDVSADLSGSNIERYKCDTAFDVDAYTLSESKEFIVATYDQNSSPEVAFGVVHKYSLTGKELQNYVMPNFYFVRALYEDESTNLFAMCYVGTNNMWHAIKMTSEGRMVWDEEIQCTSQTNTFTMPRAASSREFEKIIDTPYCAQDKRILFFWYDVDVDPCFGGLHIDGQHGKVMRSSTDMNPGVYVCGAGLIYNLVDKSIGLQSNSLHDIDIELMGTNSATLQTWSFKASNWTVDIVNSRLVLQVSSDGLKGDLWSIPKSARKCVLLGNAPFPIECNGQTFYHYDVKKKELSLYPQLFEAMKEIK